MKKFKFDILNHLFLLVCIVLLLFSFVLRNQSAIQFQIIMLTVVLYVGFAFLQHLLDKSLTIDISLEYLLIGALIMVILAGALI